MISGIELPSLLLALIYIFRIRQYLAILSDGQVHERVFLGALIVASKARIPFILVRFDLTPLFQYANDYSLNNGAWAACTGEAFSRGDILRIEQEFMDVLDYELGVTEDDLIALHEPLRAFHAAHRLTDATAAEGDVRSTSFTDDNEDAVDQRCSSCSRISSLLLEYVACSKHNHPQNSHPICHTDPSCTGEGVADSPQSFPFLSTLLHSRAFLAIECSFIG